MKPIPKKKVVADDDEPVATPVSSKTKTAKADTGLAEQLESHRSSIIELGIELEQIKRELTNEVKTKIDEGADAARAFITNVAREHFQGREDAILERLHGFLKQDIFWEHVTLSSSSVSSAKASELARQGYSYAHSVFDPDEKDVTRRHGVIYRRPKIPGTFAEFKEMYEKFVISTKESKEKRKIEEKRRAEAAERVDADVAKAILKKSKTTKKAVEPKAEDE